MFRRRAHAVASALFALAVLSGCEEVVLPRWQHVEASDAQIIALGEDARGDGVVAAVSTDGRRFVRVDVDPDAEAIAGFAYDGSVAVASLLTPELETEEVRPVLFTSTDGLSWTRDEEAPALREGGLALGGGVFVGVTVEGGIVRSTDGRAWTESAGVSPMGAVHLAHVGTRFILGDAAGGLYASTDGAAWQTLHAPFLSEASAAYSGFVEVEGELLGTLVVPENLVSMVSPTVGDAGDGDGTFTLRVTSAGAVSFEAGEGLGAVSIIERDGVYYGLAPKLVTSTDPRTIAFEREGTSRKLTDLAVFDGQLVFAARYLFVGEPDDLELARFSLPPTTE